MSILFSWLSPLRAIFMALDGIAFSLLDNAYNIVIELSKATLLNQDSIKNIINNLYILIGVIAFFRLALVLVNSIIDPEKLNEKGKGLSNIFFRVVGMVALLIVTPFLFELSYDLQGKIVGVDSGENIIFKVLLGNNNIGGENGGKALQNIAISSLITVDKRFLITNEDDNVETCKSENDTNCGFMPLTCVAVSGSSGECEMTGGYIYDSEKCISNNCQNAVEAYNKMYVNEEMSPAGLSKYAGVSLSVEGEDGVKEEVYVYNYMFLVTTAVGIFMTYIIISFAIDIAVRMFELVVLQILSPLFIATFVDPKATQSGPFKNWLSAVGKSYASLYIKLAVLALMMLLVSIGQSHIFNEMGEIGGWAKIIAVIGLLIFAKKAPKWIMDIIGIKGEDGLGGLSIGKKLGGMALAGGLATKAGRGLAAAGTGLLRGTGNHLRNKKAQRNDIADKKLGDKKARREARKQAVRDGNVGSWFSTMYDQHKGRKKAIKDAKNSGDYKGVLSKEAFGQGLTSMGAGLGSGFNAGFKAENLKGAFSAGKVSADNFKSSVGMDGSTLSERIRNTANKAGGKLVDAAFGDEGERYERADKLAKAKARKQNHTAEALSEYGDALYDGMGSYSAIAASNGKARNISDKKAIYGAILEGIKEGMANGLTKDQAMAATKANIKYDGDTLKINGNADTSRYLKIAQDNLSGAGKVDFLNKFNKEQTNTVNEYANNRQAMTDITQAMNSTKQLIENSAKAMKDAFNDIKFDSFSARVALDASTGKVKIDGSDFDFDSLGEKIGELKMTGNANDSELARLLEDKTLLDAMEQNKTYTSILDSQESEAVNLQKRNSELYVQVLGVQDKYDKETGTTKLDKDGNIIKDSGALTIAGAQDTLARDKDAISKMVEASKKKLEKEESK